MRRKRIRRSGRWVHSSYYISPFFSPGPLIPVIEGNEQYQRLKSAIKEKKVTKLNMQSGTLQVRVMFPFICDVYGSTGAI